VRRPWRVALAALIGGLTVLAVFTLKGCASSRTVDLVGQGRQALAATDAVVWRGSEQEPVEIVERVASFVNLFDQFSPPTVGEAARALYSEGAYFNDGFVELNGIEAIVAYLEESAGLATGVSVEVEDQVVRDGEVYVRWVMRFATRSRTFVAPGMSHLRFDRDGRIAYHRDYWDASAALAELVPLVAPALRAVRSRLEPSTPAD
jgi:hypothetical protein